MSDYNALVKKLTEEGEVSRCYSKELLSKCWQVSHYLAERLYEAGFNFSWSCWGIAIKVVKHDNAWQLAFVLQRKNGVWLTIGEDIEACEPFVQKLRAGWLEAVLRDRQQRNRWIKNSIEELDKFWAMICK